MRISDWSSDVCSSDLRSLFPQPRLELVRRGIDQQIGGIDAALVGLVARRPQDAIVLRQRPLDVHVLHEDVELLAQQRLQVARDRACPEQVHVARILPDQIAEARSEEHTSELQSLMRISYAVFCLKKKTTKSCNSS